MFKLSTIFFLLFSSLNLYATQSGLYVELEAGLGSLDKLETPTTNFTYNRAYCASAALGYQLRNYRIELQTKRKTGSLYSYNNISRDGEILQTSNMLNAYYSKYNQSKLVTTVGFGAGVSSIELNEMKHFSVTQPNIKESSILSAQAMFSVGYMINRHLTLSTKYSYFYINSSENFKANTESLFSLSIRYIF